MTFKTIDDLQASMTVEQVADGLCKPERELLRSFPANSLQRLSVKAMPPRRLKVLFDHKLVWWSKDGGGKRTKRGDAVVAHLDKIGRV